MDCFSVCSRVDIAKDFSRGFVEVATLPMLSGGLPIRLNPKCLSRRAFYKNFALISMRTVSRGPRLDCQQTSLAPDPYTLPTTTPSPGP